MAAMTRRFCRAVCPFTSSHAVAARLDQRGGGDGDVDQAPGVRLRGRFSGDGAPRAYHDVRETGQRVDRVRPLRRDLGRQLPREGAVVERRELRAEHAVVERRDLRDLRHERVDLVAHATGRQPVAVHLQLGEQGCRQLVVGCVAQRLEARVGLLDLDREVADLLDLPLVVAHVVASLELVREEIVARVVVVGQREVALEEARRGGGLELGAREPAVRPHLGELVPRVGLCEILLEDVAADEVVVIGERVPLIEIAREQVRDPHALLAERLRPRSPERGAEDRVRPTGAPDDVLDHHGKLLPVGTDAVVLRVRALHLREAEGEVPAQVVLLRPGQRRRLEPGRGRREGEQGQQDAGREPRPGRPSGSGGLRHGGHPLADIETQGNHPHA
jgi:hypothetical protein